MNINEAKTKYALQIEESAPVLSALQSLLIGKMLYNEEVKTLRAYDCLQKYLDLPLNTPIGDHLKKIYAIGIIAAHQKGILRLPEGFDNAEAVASIVDEGLTRLKTAYQVAEGKINPIDAETVTNDRLYVRTAAAVNIVVDKSVQKAKEYVAKAEEKALSVSDKLIAMGLDTVSGVVCTVVPRIFPPAAIVVPVVKKAIAFVKPVVQHVVQKGIRMVAKVACNTIKRVASTVKRVAKGIFNFLFG